MPKPKVSVIIVNLNGERFLDSCLSSLRSQTFQDFEVIIVDNHSTDGSLEFLQTHYRDFVKIIKNPENSGFAKGNNIGIRVSEGEFIVTLNNDTKADSRFLQELLKTVLTAEEIGMCASKVRLLGRHDTIDSVGVNIYWDGMSRQRGRLAKDTGQFDKEDEALIPSACAALYRKSMLDEIGLFDEDFFAYCEDTDLGLRARLAGWKCALSPQAVVHHFYSGTAGKYSALKVFMVERNHLWVALKIFPLEILLLLPFFTLLRLVVQVKSAINYSAKITDPAERLPSREIFISMLKAYLSALSNLPTIFKKRCNILSKKKIAHAEIYSLFRKFRLRARDFALE